MIDSTGRTYPEDGTLFVFPASPPYGAFFNFKTGFEPSAADITTVGDTPAVAAFAAPYAVSGTPCCAEDEPTNRIPVKARLTSATGLLVTIPDAVPAGSQISIFLDDGALFASRISPCTLPSAEFCGWAPHSGFAMRFYVGALPPAAISGP